MEEPNEDSIPEFLKGLRDRHNSLTESVDYLKRRLPQEIKVNGIPVAAYWTVNAYKDAGDVWRPIDNSKVCWALSLDTVAENYVVYKCAAGVDPVVWAAMLTVNITTGVVIPGSISVGGLTVTAFTIPGFVKNTGAGVLTGGNLITYAEITLITGEAISALRGIITDAAGVAWKGSANTAADINRLRGISTTSAALGDTISVTTSGYVHDAGWAWDPLFPIWLGPSGTLVQDPTGLAFWQQVGTALSPTEMIVSISPGILRA